MANRFLKIIFALYFALMCATLTLHLKSCLKNYGKLPPNKQVLDEKKRQ